MEKNPNEDEAQEQSKFENDIRKEFLEKIGKLTFSKIGKEKEWKYMIKLTRLEISDICYLGAYACSFEQLYYKCEFDGKEQKTNHYNNLYFMKLLGS